MKNINKTYHENGSLHEEYSLNDKGERDGFYRCYHENGQLKVELKFKDGKQEDGLAISYHDNGNKAREVFIENSRRQGEFQEWFPDGRLKLKGIYEDNQIVKELYKPTVLPGWFLKEGRQHEVGAEVQNQLSGEVYTLNSDELAMYDLIIGLKFTIFNFGNMSDPETQEHLKTIDQAISWFKENNAEAYKVLLER